MKIAWLNLRYTVPERQQAFIEGLRRIGYQVERGIPSRCELFVTWNRIGAANNVQADRILVAENATWGNEFQGQRWYQIQEGFHNVKCRHGDSERWDRLGVELDPWRTFGETVILPQRGIGPPGIAMPRGWGNHFHGRIRQHPGRHQSVDLKQDLKDCGRVITWGSGAAVKALMWGIPVESHMPNWIGEQDNTDQGRLDMLRKLAWAQWTLDEIINGEAFDWLLRGSQ